MADPVAPEPVLPQTWLEKVENWFEIRIAEISSFVHNDYVLATQFLLSCAAAAYCGLQIHHENHKYQASVWFAVVIGYIYLVLAFTCFRCRDCMARWARAKMVKYGVFYYVLRVFGIGGVLKLCIFLSDILGVLKTLDGYVIGVFLCGYWNVVCFMKLLRIADEVGLSDSIMAMALLIIDRLDSKKTVLRSVISYVSAFLLICFRYATLPPTTEVVVDTTPTTGVELQDIAIDVEAQLNLPTTGAGGARRAEEHEAAHRAEEHGAAHRAENPEAAHRAEEHEASVNSVPAHPTVQATAENPEAAHRSEEHEASVNSVPAHPTVQATAENPEAAHRAEEPQASVNSVPAHPTVQATVENPEAAHRAEEPQATHLLRVRINPADVELIASELELEKHVVERFLRKHEGDKVAATRELLSRYEEFL